MHFTGTQQIKAPVAKVWQFVLDPNKVAECAPGFKTMDILGPDHFKPTLAVGIGAVKATFTLDVQLEDVREPEHAAMRGRGAAAGSAVDMVAAMDLKPLSDTETQMDWTADVNVSGTLASVGARLMEGTAHRLTARFFDCFRQKLEESNDVAGAGATTSAPATGASGSSEAS
ncbi:MAG TPA: carbon monoxide dehydrogenase subunit G [Ktedonobacterales bacterium]|nr:carbon monoxide dehydrogenase subunit G [Ktedonobacterales bacterium]HEX5570804.1 carbon monoxide dehydrogenase subunit G [Ktedonobacterales bacterium]